MFFHYDRTYVFNFKLINKKNISSESLVREKYEEKKTHKVLTVAGFKSGQYVLIFGSYLLH